MLLTCGRPNEREEYAFKTLDALKNLSATGDELWLHVADDGSDPEFREALMARARAQFGDRTSISNSEGRGYGGSYNLSMQDAHRVADLVLPLEDDWELSRPFDLAPIAAALRADVFRCCRLVALARPVYMPERHHGGGGQRRCQRQADKAEQGTGHELA